MKKLIYLIVFVFVTTSAISSPKHFPKKVDIIEINKSNKDLAAKPLRLINQMKTIKPFDIYYQFILHNNGCFYLYRIYNLDGMVWGEAIDPTYYHGTTSFCPYEENMNIMC